MTRGDTRQIAALIAAVLALGVLLAACGDSDSDSTTSTPETSATAPGEGNSGNTSEPQGSNSGETSQRSGDSDSSGDSDASDEPVSTPLKVSGGGSEQFRVKGGDNSIQEYGDESDESELEEVAEIVHGFYVARAEEDWSKACSYLAESMVSQLEALATQSPEFKERGCAPVLKAFTRPLPASVRRETTVVDAGSFRHNDERGFLIYYDAEDKPYAIPLEAEDDTWKLTLLAATPLG